MGWEPIDHGLEFLLDFDGRVHHLREGYWIKFEIRKVPSTPGRPHGLAYSFTLHEPGGRRLVGFDNAHAAARRTGRRRGERQDHWHRGESDRGRRYDYKDAATLVADFFAEVERVLAERGIGTEVIRVEEKY